jgi:hypothetical protein
MLLAFLVYAIVAAVYAVATDGVLRDDAYIFFTYARNLAQSGILAFNPGELSFGVTSISWTGLLLIGTALLPDPVVIAKLFGILLGAGGAVLWARWLARQLAVSFPVTAVVFAALLPNIGADRMVEGMETALLCFVSGLLLNLLASRRRYRHWLVGLTLGLLMLTRPEMVLALIVVAFVLLRADGVIGALKTLLATAAVWAWWPIWLHSQTGSFLPPTRIGKLSVFLPEHLGITIGQLESGDVLIHLGWGLTSVKQFAQSSISGTFFLALLILTTVCAVWGIVKLRRSQWSYLTLAPAATWLLLAVYCYSFPLLQLRYFLWLAPALVASLLLLLSLLMQPRHYRFLPVCLILICLMTQPMALKRRIESTDIQQLRRAVGETIRRQAPVGARIALEPIGEIGFYADRYIVDMGGITDLRIQPHLRDGFVNTSETWRCLMDFRADYLVTYDDDGFLGRLPRDYPDRFDFVCYVPDQRVRGIRYRLLAVKRE